jgi:hypothetical protein
MRRNRDDIEEAAKINCHACEFCNAVHVDLIDADGLVYATASVPLEIEQDFIARFCECVREVQARPHPAPARRQ